MVFECVKNLEKYRKEDANIESRIHAIGWSGLFNGFKGESGADIDYVDLLPFSDEVRASNRRVSDRTYAIIKQAINEQSLPMPILSALSRLL